MVFISYKNENVNKDACHAHYLQQNPTYPYIFRKYIKYTFISNREIIGYIKVMTASSEQEKIYNFWLLTTNTNHFQLIFEGKLNNNTEINLF